MSNRDKLVRFLFENTPVRAAIVQLESSWQAILERHQYPTVVKNLLGEALAATVLLASTIKFKGSLVLQIQGSGPLTLLVVQMESAGTVRATAEWKELPAENQTLLTDLFSDGRLAITIDPDNTSERYQGIVGLGDGGVREAIEGYFLQSEQINTHIWLAANDSYVSGLLIQEMPEKSSTESELESELDGDEIWNRVTQLSETITARELLDLEIDSIIHRLYHEEDVRVFDPDLISFRCNCSKQRIIDVLRNLGSVEVHSLLAEKGCVSVSCEYCKLETVFDAVDIEQIFTTEVPASTPKTKH